MGVLASLLVQELAGWVHQFTRLRELARVPLVALSVSELVVVLHRAVEVSALRAQTQAVLDQQVCLHFLLGQLALVMQDH